MSATAIFPLAQWLASTNQNSTPSNDNALRLQAAIGPAIGFQFVEPISAVDYDSYVIGGAWSGFAVGNVIIYLGGTWKEFACYEGQVKVIAGVVYARQGGVWRPCPMYRPVPTSAASDGEPGQVSYDDDNFYVCTNAGVWARAALSTW